MTIPTQDEIVVRAAKRRENDFFGFETLDYIEHLDYEHAKQFLRTEAMTEENRAEWDKKFVPLTRDALLVIMKEYMSFAFGKANDQRGLSAGRSIAHYIAWTWLAGDRELSLTLEDDYEFYGKPHLRKICEFYGWDWRVWDDGNLSNGDG